MASGEQEPIPLFFWEAGTSLMLLLAIHCLLGLLSLSEPPGNGAVHISLMFQVHRFWRRSCKLGTCKAAPLKLRISNI